MKDKDAILTLKETEELCRLYLDCRLSVEEEVELHYLLARVDYRSPVIDEARESMEAEALLRDGKARRQTGITRKIAPGPRRMAWIWAGGVAASVAILLAALPMLRSHDGGSVAGQPEMIVAYESGRQLHGEEAEEAVFDSMRKAEMLMAMADESERADREKQEMILKLTN